MTACHLLYRLTPVQAYHQNEGHEGKSCNTPSKPKYLTISLHVALETAGDSFEGVVVLTMRIMVRFLKMVYTGILRYCYQSQFMSMQVSIRIGVY